MTELVLDRNSRKLERAITTEEVDQRESGIAVLSDSANGFDRDMGHNEPEKRDPRRALWVMAALIVGIAACVLWLQWGRIRCYLQAGAVLAQLDGHTLPGLLNPIAGKRIEVQEFQLPIADGPVRARIYEPATEKNGPGLVIVPGVYYQGIDEPRLTGYARWMAACGLRVLTPELPGAREYKIDRTSVELIGQSAQWFAQRTGKPVALMAISFSGGLSLLAAADPQYASSVKMIFTTGAPDDMTRVAEYYASGLAQHPDGTHEDLKPNIFGPLVVEYSHLDHIDTLKYRELMRRVLHAHLSNDRVGEEQLTAALNPAQKAELASLLDPRQVGAAIARTTPGMREQMEAVSPHGHLAGLRVPVYILHGQKDPVIPSVEEEWLAKDLPPGTLRARLISPAIAHINLGMEKHTLMDKLRLWRFMGQVMEAAQAR